MNWLRLLIISLIVGCASTLSPSLLRKGPQPEGLKFRVLLGQKTNQAKLEALVKEKILEKFGNVDDVKTTVWWVEGELRWWAYSDDDEYRRLDHKTTYWGLCFGCGEIYVLDRSTSICGTSYVHELIHCYYSKVTGKRDFRHKSEWWDLVEPIREECYRRGW